MVPIFQAIFQPFLGMYVYGGHYVTLVKRQGRWFEINDDHRINVSSEDALNNVQDLQNQIAPFLGEIYVFRRI